jgi:hypothetical protein
LFGDHFAAKKFGDQNTHFLVIISQLEFLVIKTQLFGDQKTIFPCINAILKYNFSFDAL